MLLQTAVSHGIDKVFHVSEPLVRHLEWNHDETVANARLDLISQLQWLTHPLRNPLLFEGAFPIDRMGGFIGYQVNISSRAPGAHRLTRNRF